MRTIPISDCQAEYAEPHDPIGQAIQAVASAAEHLKDMVVLGNPDRTMNLDRMANSTDIDILCHAMAQIQLVASSADVRRIANEEMQ